MSRHPVQVKQATVAARRYFLDGWTVKQIGVELGVSRFKAARLIDMARAQGLVRIEIVGPAESDIDLGERLRRAFGLRDAIVAAGLDGSSQAIAPELAQVAAHVVTELVGPSDVLGISWGHTLDLVVDQMGDFRAKRVVQLVGGQATLESTSGGIEVVRRLAAKGGASGYPLLAPLRLRDSAAVDALRRDPAVAETLGLIDEVTVIVGGIGSWGDRSASRMTECFDDQEVQALEEQGVVADLCGFLFGEDGPVPGPLDAQRIGISLEQLDRAGTVVAVCGGNEKRAALRAVLRSGLVDIIVTDAGSALEVLEKAGH